MAPLRDPGPRVHFHHPIEGGVSELQGELPYRFPERSGDPSRRDRGVVRRPPPLFLSSEEVVLENRNPEVEEFDEERLHRAGGRGEEDALAEGEGEHIPFRRGLTKRRRDLPGSAPFEAASRTDRPDAPILSFRAGQPSFQEPVHSPVECLPVSYRGREIEGNPDRSGAVKRAHRIEAFPSGQLSGLFSEGPEVAQERRKGQISEFSERADVETFQSLQHLFGEGEDGDGRGGEEGGERSVFHEDRLTRAGGRGGDPGPEAPRSPPHSDRGHERTGKDFQKKVEDPIHLGSRSAVEPLQPIHSHLEDSRFRGLDDRAHPFEDLEDVPSRRLVVGWIRFEESQGGAERNGLGDPHPGADPRLGRSL